MESGPTISFEDTSIAFSYKSDTELKKAHFIFSLVNHPWISALATRLVKVGFQLNLPIEGIIKKTVFFHFCGGESIDASKPVVDKLGKYGVQTILDFSVEGEETEKAFEKTAQEIIRTIENAKGKPNMPFCVFKPTGVASTTLLEKIQSREPLTEVEKLSYEKIKYRFDLICSKAHDHKIPVLIDAEETWIQDPIDTLVYEMMKKYNSEKAIVFNTFQMYRTSSLQNLRAALHAASQENYFIGAKLVRGAYMEKERARAEKLGYPSPIQPDKGATDKAFNEALEFCVENKHRFTTMCGSHNEYSNQYLAQLMVKHRIAHTDERFWFAQLYGMSDNITFNLAKAGYRVAKYVPYGPVKSVMPYLFRRAAENTSVAGQSSRELILIRKELKRRKGK